MSSTSKPTSPSADFWSSNPTPPVPVESSSLPRRSRPAQVQTSHQFSMQPSSMPTSAISASTVASSFQHDSPIVSPDHTVMTASSSVQPSPDQGRGRDADGFPPLHIGPPLLNHKPSINSINPSIATSGGSLADLMNNHQPGLIRRFSNRAAKFARNRRQSSVAPKSRDGSIGPGILRRRSDSTNTAPPAEAVALIDSDDEPHDESLDLLNCIYGAETSTRDVSSGSPAASIAGSTSIAECPAGSLVPYALIKGTWLTKVSKKNKTKRFLFTIDSDDAKIVLNKDRSSKYIYIDDIKEVRVKSDIRQYRNDFGLPECDETRFFTIFYAVPDKAKSKMMHLVADDEETVNQWVNALDSIAKHRQVHMESLMAFNDNAIREFWANEMARHKQYAAEEEGMSFAGIERVCRNLHIHIAHKDLVAKFSLAGPDKAGRLSFAGFQGFVREMRRREDIMFIYRSIASNPEKGITFQEFTQFLREIQCEDDVESNSRVWEARFIRHSIRGRPKEPMFQRADRDLVTMNEQAFTAFLVSKDNYHLSPAPADKLLDRPLNEYFISSSHNTYLVGRQIADVSSVEGYISTLVRGCRSVEVDCWDGPDGQPVVKHGYAMTNPISFRQVITAIDKYAFEANPFPLFISLEVHCVAAQQEVMAEIIKEIFKQRLVTEPLDPSSDKLPSPEQLREKILIKVKGTHQSHEQRNNGEFSGRRRNNSLTSPFAKAAVLDNASIPPLYLSSSPRLGPSQPPKRMAIKQETITEGKVHDAASSSTSDCDSEAEKSGKRKTSKIVKSLGDLGVYCSGMKFDGFESAGCKKSNHILSFMEGTFRKHSKAPDSKLALTRHNMRYMMRVYPQYSRLSSDNFNPLMYWRKGVQMAALNWQTFDLGMQLNQAMFDGGTDRSGYVLKPASMREFRILPSPLPEKYTGKFERYSLNFNIDVISAQQLMRPAYFSRNLDPFVEIEIYHANDKRDKHDSMVGVPGLSDTPLKFFTRVVRENGFNPMFNKKCPFSITTKYPELVFVKFTVKLAPSTDSENPSGRGVEIANYTAKLSSLRQGYRTLPLLDSNGDQFLFSTLFCRIKVEAATHVYLENPGASGSESMGKLKHIGRNVFTRSLNARRPSFEKPPTTSSTHTDDPLLT